MTDTSIDPVKLTQSLIRCPSVTPQNAGALEIVGQVLSDAGFETTRVDRGGVCNLFARWGDLGRDRSFGFNGHTDVVPAGDPSDWTNDPFAGVIKGGAIWGRGAADMKSGVAAFVAAAVDFVRTTPPDGAIIMTITGDEEGDARHGTRALLDYMIERGEKMSICLVGEPTCPDYMGQMMKIGRRGSMTADFTATGVQGHSAYPDRARNPIPTLARLVERLAGHKLDAGSEHFGPSTLAVVNFDTGNATNNVIPGRCFARVNIRFNDLHTSQSLGAWLREEAALISEDSGIEIATDIQVSGESFLTPPGDLSKLVTDAVMAETGLVPEASTSGGTSDARFVKDHCPVVEFGLVGETMHKVDEHVAVDHIHQLKSIYQRMLELYFR